MPATKGSQVRRPAERPEVEERRPPSDQTVRTAALSDMVADRSVAGNCPDLAKEATTSSSTTTPSQHGGAAAEQPPKEKKKVRFKTSNSKQLKTDKSDKLQNQKKTAKSEAPPHWRAAKPHNWRRAGFAPAQHIYYVQGDCKVFATGMDQHGQ